MRSTPANPTTWRIALEGSLMEVAVPASQDPWIFDHSGTKYLATLLLGPSDGQILPVSRVFF